MRTPEPPGEKAPRTSQRQGKAPMSGGRSPYSMMRSQFITEPVWAEQMRTFAEPEERTAYPCTSLGYTREAERSCISMGYPI
jgi:hypothetical protein